MSKRRLSIATILIAVLTTFTPLVFLLLGVIFNKSMVSFIEETSINYSHQLINQIQFNLNNFYEDIDNILYNFVTTNNLVDILKGYKQQDAYTQLDNRKSIARMISSFTSAHDEVTSIFVLNQDTFFSLPSIQFQSDEFIQQVREEYPEFEFVKPRYYPVAYPHYYSQAIYKKEMFVAIPVRDYRGHDKNTYGVILASIKTDKLDNLLSLR